MLIFVPFFLRMQWFLLFLSLTMLGFAFAFYR